MVLPTYTHDVNFIAPSLPYPPQLYDSVYFEAINDMLRVYFNQLDEALRDGSTQRNAESMAWFLG